MRRVAITFSRFLLLGLALPAAALAAPSASRLPTRTAAPAQETDAADMKCVKGPDGASTCAGQAESFERAAQASSYLAIYLSQYSGFARDIVRNPEHLKQLQSSVANCLQGNSKCGPDDQINLAAAIIQYNLGKEVKSMMLKNNTNQANMESIKTPDGKYLFSGKQQLARGTSRTYADTFKLQPKDFDTVETFKRGPASEKERRSLGEDFKQDYLKFIDTYTRTTRDQDYWHRAYARPAGGSTTHAVWDIDPGTNAPKMKNEQFIFDMAAQGNDKVRKIIADAKSRIEAPEIEAVKGKPGVAKFKKDPAESLQFDTFALGVPSDGVIKEGDKVYKTFEERKIARGIANNINDRIAEKEAEEKKNKGVGRVNVQLSVEQFDEYLDKIWPRTGYKYRIPSSQK